MSAHDFILPKKEQYVLNDLFFRELLGVLSYEVNEVMIYDPLYYEVANIFIGICNLIFNRRSYIEQDNIDDFFNGNEYCCLGNIVSVSEYPNKYIKLKSENNTNISLYYKFFEELKTKELIELRFDTNTICNDVIEIIKNICN